MDHQQLLPLLDKYLRNECTDEEKQAVESWYGRFESRHATGTPDTAPALEAVYRNMVEQLQQEGEWAGTPVRRMRGRWWLAAAAVLLLVMGAGGLAALPATGYGNGCKRPQGNARPLPCRMEPAFGST